MKIFIFKMYWRSNWGVSTASGANGTKDEEA